jgi:predicted phage terminase large subunit-like protein
MKRKPAKRSARPKKASAGAPPPQGPPPTVSRFICPTCGSQSLINEKTGQPNYRCKNDHKWWVPFHGPQERFLSLRCDEAMVGGAAGGGKTIIMLMDAARGIIHGRGYHALMLRRTFPELQGTLIKASLDVYPGLGGKYNQGKKLWIFESGARIEFGHMQHESDMLQYQGRELSRIYVDELTTFLESQYIYLFSRLRSSQGIPTAIRSATNPGSSGHEWVFKRWAAWLDPESPVKAKSGEVLYFLRDDGGKEQLVEKGTPGSQSRTFIAARLEDNPVLYGDGQYAAKLQLLDHVSYQRLRFGDWLIQPAKGLYFHRTDIYPTYDALGHKLSEGKIVESVPAELNRLRYWDLAATVAEGGKDPDWTVGLLLGMTPDKSKCYVLDVVRERKNAGDIQNTIVATAQMDGTDVAIAMEQEPGASGKAVIEAYARALTGWKFTGCTKRNNKLVAASPVSSDCKNGKLYFRKGDWNEDLMRELEQFPEGSHDDQVDALSGAHTQLAGAPKPRVDRGPSVGAVAPPTDVDRMPAGY